VGIFAILNLLGAIYLSMMADRQSTMMHRTAFNASFAVPVIMTLAVWMGEGSQRWIAFFNKLLLYRSALPTAFSSWDKSPDVWAVACESSILSCIQFTKAADPHDTVAASVKISTPRVIPLGISCSSRYRLKYHEARKNTMVEMTRMSMVSLLWWKSTVWY
jgi:hypothetical protein